MDSRLDEVLPLLNAGQLQQAAAVCLQVLKENNREGDAWHYLGLATQGAGRDDLAVQYLQNAVHCTPGQALFHNNLGAALAMSGRKTEAIASFQQALVLKHDYEDAWSNLARAEEHDERPVLRLARIHLDQFRIDLAYQDCQEALRRNPDSVGANTLMGVVCKTRKDYRQAIRYLHQALRLNANHIASWFNLSDTLRDMGRLTWAIKALERIAAINPTLPRVHGEMGDTYQHLNQPERALACFRRALALQPMQLKTHGTMLFVMSYFGLAGPAELYAEHRLWDERHGQPGRDNAFVQTPPSQPRERLKVGFVSADFFNHAVASFFMPVLAALDRQRLEIHLYSSVNRPDAVTERFHGMVEKWRSVKEINNEQLARLIHDDGIDLLVDLSGHTAGNRLQAFTWKPAPVQATWLGYFTTTGLAAMDYWITDPWLHPGEDPGELASETIWRLPRCWIAYQPRADAPAPEPGDWPGVTFGCFNSFRKISPEVVVLWGRILERCPGSRLLLKSTWEVDSSLRKELLGRFAAQGIAPERVVLMGRVARFQEHLALYNEVDVALDTLPLTGGTTTAEALWMGVPVVTLSGRGLVGRMSTSMLTAVGETGWITHTPEEYVDRAVSLAGQGKRDAAARQSLRAQMAASPLCDAVGLARALETAFFQMWQRWREGATVTSPPPG